jgi:hypothetical protein
MGDDERLTAKQFQQAGGVEDWRVLAFGASAWFDAPSHTADAALVRRVADRQVWPGPAGIDRGGALLRVAQQLADLLHRRAGREQVTRRRVPHPVRPDLGTPARAQAAATKTVTDETARPLSVKVELDTP